MMNVICRAYKLECNTNFKLFPLFTTCYGVNSNTYLNVIFRKTAQKPKAKGQKWPGTLRWNITPEQPGQKDKAR